MQERLAAAAAWFVVAGVGLAALGTIPAYIAGIDSTRFATFVSWSALIVGVIGGWWGKGPFR